MNTKIITSGEKLKDIRKKYHIKQYELSGNDLTRNMISMIETNKAGLTKNTAETLLKNIYKVCNERDLECDVTLEYLLESAEYQAKTICHKFIVLLNNNPAKILEDTFQKDLNEIQNLLDKYKLKKEKVIIYLKLSEIFESYNDFYKAYLYSLRAFENYHSLFNNIELINLIVSLTYYCNHLNKFKETLNFVKLSYIYMNDIPKNPEYKLKFNSVIAYKNLKDYDLALKEINEIEYKFKDMLNNETLKKINVMILKANCLKESLSFIDALNIHKEILHLTKNNIDLYLVTLCNILEIYMELKDSKNIKLSLDKCILYLKNYNNLNNKRFTCEIYNSIGLGYYSINNYEMSKVYFNKALKESKNIKNINVLTSSLKKLLNIAINNGSLNEINDLKNHLIEILSLKLLPINNTIIFDFIKFYNDLGDKESINDLVNFSKSILN